MTATSPLELRVSAAIVQQRSLLRPACPFHLADTDQVVAGFVSIGHAALEVRNRIVQQNDTAFGTRVANAIEAPRGEFGETSGQRLLPLLENADAEVRR